MTIWTPKTPGGVRSHWAPETAGTWKESNILVYSTQIKLGRLVHLENVYRYMHHYLSEEGWTSKSADGKDKWFEDFYGEYRDQEDHKEIRCWWRLQKACGGIFGQHAYFRHSLYIDILTTNMKRVEIMYNGKKIKPYFGEFLLWVNAVVEMDINGWFSGKPGVEAHKVLSILEDFFPRMIYKNRVREQEIELRRISEMFVEDVKFYIGLNRSSDVRKPMEPNKQWF